MRLIFYLLGCAGWLYNLLECYHMVQSGAVLSLSDITIPIAIKMGGIIFGYGTFLGWLEIFNLF